jgi:hypothetical protein
MSYFVETDVRPIAPLLGPWRLGALQCVYRREGG